MNIKRFYTRFYLSSIIHVKLESAKQNNKKQKKKWIIESRALLRKIANDCNLGAFYFQKRRSFALILEKKSEQRPREFIITVIQACCFEV